MKNADDHSGFQILKSRLIEEEEEMFLELSAKPCRGKGAQLKEERPQRGFIKQDVVFVPPALSSGQQP